MSNPTPAVPRTADEEIAAFVTSVQRQATNPLTSALRNWTRAAERYPQLTPEAQNELAADFQAGIAAKEELRTTPSRKRGVREMRRLDEAARRGEYAIEYLAAANFRLVHLIANEKAKERWGAEKAIEVLPDLIGEANIALIEAARAFNPAAGPKFPTYAARVVRDRMLAMLTRDHHMRLPPSWNRLKRVASVRQNILTNELGRPPSRGEFEADLLETCLQWAFEHLSDDERKLPKKQRLEKQMDRLRKQGMLGAIEHLDEILLYSMELTELNATIGDDGASLMDMLSDAADAPPGAAIEVEEMKMAVAEMLTALPARDREIILHRFGFVDGEAWAYQQISELFGVSAERIRQIEKAALDKLRLPGAASHLQSFLGTQYDDEE
jgi:RNA polymerase primary sigma factor